MKKVLVTGAGGFIGSHLATELVERGFNVRALLHYNSRSSYGNLDFFSPEILQNIEFFRGNLEDISSLKEAIKGCDTVFHLAALISIPYSYVAPESYVKTNILGTINLMQVCREENVAKIVHTSTSETYGTARYTPIDEKHPLQGQSPYSASKIGADKIVESFYKSFDTPVATLRPFNTYGPGQSSRAIIPTIITQALTTKDKKIKLGILTPVRDLTFVKDTVDGFIKIAQTEGTEGKLINTGNGYGITIGDLANKIIKLIDPDIRILHEKERERPPKSEVMELICDNSRAKEILSWEPRYTIDEGLLKTIDFIRKNMSFYKPGLYLL
jgi:NAD dependent epimerase/dehydratase